MQQDGDQQSKGEIPDALGRVSKHCFGVEIAHRDGKEEVARNGQDGAQQADFPPRVRIGKEIADIFKRGESHSDTDRIDDTVDIFVKIRVLSQKQPQAQKFGNFFRQAGGQERVPESAEGRGRFRDGDHRNSRAKNPQHDKDGKNTVAEGFQKLAHGFALVLVFPINVINQYKGGQHRRNQDFYYFRHLFSG